jgi:hypothetical protein
MTKRLILCLAAVLLIWGNAQACMRQQLDARAVQWSNLIAKATFSGMEDPKPLADGIKIVTYHLTLQRVLDGVGVAGDKIDIVRFFGNTTDDSKTCEVSLDNNAKGKSFIVALRKADQATLPKGVKLEHAKDLYVPVFIADGSDYDAGATEDLQRLISDTRKSESAAGDQDIKQQVHAAAYAEDDTEASEAEDAIKQMGTKALPELQKQMKDAPSAGKTRVKRLIDELTPPTVAIEPMES